MVDQRHFFTQMQLSEPMILFVLLPGLYVTQRQMKLRKTHPGVRDDSKATFLELRIQTEDPWISVGTILPQLQFTQA